MYLCTTCGQYYNLDQKDEWTIVERCPNKPECNPLRGWAPGTENRYGTCADCHRAETLKKLESPPGLKKLFNFVKKR
jgi:hypothetical protein